MGEIIVRILDQEENATMKIPETSDPGSIGTDAQSGAQLQPNTLSINADVTSSTFSNFTAGHSIFSNSNFFNTAFNRSNLESCHFQGCEFDGSMIENSSLRGVELRNCDVDGLVINGINVGSLIKLLTR